MSFKVYESLTKKPATGEQPSVGGACPYLRSGAEGGGLEGGARHGVPCPHQSTCGQGPGQSGDGRSVKPVTFGGLVLVGLNHQTADVGLREKFFTEQLERMHRELSELGLAEVGVLFTCNRIEVYSTGGAGSASRVVAHFARRSGLTVEALRPHLYVAEADDAALHLMRVAAGLESMVLGESQILGQVASALAAGREYGTVGPVLSRVFSAAVQAGKRARAETDIGKHTLSVSHAGVMLARSAVRDFARARVAVLGAGEMARLAISALRSHGVGLPGVGLPGDVEHSCGEVGTGAGEATGQQITVLNRTASRGRELAIECGVASADWEDLAAVVAESDVVIAATGALTPVVTWQTLPGDGRARVFIDLGVPRNIDASVAEVAGAQVHDVDALRQVVEQHRILRQREVGKVETILDQELERCLEQLRTQHLAPVITGLREKVEGVVSNELEKALRRLPELDENTRSLLELMAHRIATKILHEPTVALRSAAGPQVAKALCEAFGLDSIAAKSPTTARAGGPGGGGSGEGATDIVREGPKGGGCPYSGQG